jgi:hypothetical protein
MRLAVADDKERQEGRCEQGSTYSTFVDAGLADVTLDIAKFMLSGDGWNWRGGGVGKREVLVGGGLLHVLVGPYRYGYR